MKLYVIPPCPFVERVKIYMHEQNIFEKFNLENVDLSNPPQELLNVNPNGSVPTLVFENKTGFGESLTIVEYMDDACVENQAKTLPNDVKARSELKAHWGLVDSKFLQPIQKILYARGNAHTITDSQKFLKLAFEFFEKELEKDNFSSHEKLSFMDIAIAPFLLRFQKLCEVRPNILRIPSKSRLANYTNWLLNHPAVVKGTLSGNALKEAVEKFAVPAENLQKVIAAERSLIDVSTKKLPQGWVVEQSAKGPHLRKTWEFSNVRVAAKAFHDIQEACDTVDHHVELNVKNNTHFEIIVCTHEPKWGVSAKDFALAEALSELISKS